MISAEEDSEENMLGHYLLCIIIHIDDHLTVVEN